MNKKDLILLNIFSFIFVFIFVSGIFHWLNYFLHLDVVKFTEGAVIGTILYNILMSIYLIKKGD